MLRFALLAGLLLAPLAASQAPTPAFELAVFPPQGPLAPGDVAGLKLAVSRSCSAAAGVLPQQAVDLRFTGESGVRVAGPLTLSFDEQVCAAQPTLTVEGNYQVALDPDAEDGRAYVVRVTLEPSYSGNPLQQPGNAASADFLVAAADLDTASAAEVAPVPQQEAPAPAAALLALGLLALAFVVRRGA